MKNYMKIVAISLLSVLLVNIYSENGKDDIDLDKDLQAIEKEIKKLERKVRKQEEEEKDINVRKEMEKVEKLMRRIYKDFNEVSAGKQGEEIIARLKKIDEKFNDIISRINLTMQPIVKKEDDSISILEKIIKNWVFEMSNSKNQSKQQKKDQKIEMSEKELQKLLAQLKKQREKERKNKQKQNKPTAQNPATSAYDVPPSEPPTGENKTSPGSGMSWGNMPEKDREAVEETEPEEIPQDISELYKEFKKALGKEDNK